MTTMQQAPARWHAHYSSPIGTLDIATDGSALTGLWYQGQAHYPLPHELGELIDDPRGIAAEAQEIADSIGQEAEEATEHDYVPAARLLAKAMTQLDEYFARERTDFDLPLDPEGTDFQLMVWEHLKTVPSGYTTTYGEISRIVGPGAPAQAVGQAVGRNKISIIIPCHRVVGAHGDLTGYAGGIERKKFLLDLEEPEEVRAGRLF